MGYTQYAAGQKALDDVLVDQRRGPPAGCVSGVYEDTAIHFLAFNVEWNFGEAGD